MFHWYGLIIGIAVVVWWSIAEYLEPRLKKIIPTTLLLSLLGSRTYYIFQYWSHYQANIFETLAVWNGGLSIWGALLLGGGYTWLYGRNLIWAVVTPLPLAQAMGRLGNGVNGEFTNMVLGIPWWGFEALLDLGLFGVILITPKKMRVGVYLLGYGLIRLVLSPYR